MMDCEAWLPFGSSFFTIWLDPHQSCIVFFSRPDLVCKCPHFLYSKRACTYGIYSQIREYASAGVGHHPPPFPLTSSHA
ncbi:hypothetical protein BASA60_006245 [Batrachochytrium salamandrivorans]|nr:hypothetical protein BASA60_006245 [Batrachochytrium salamandrivorans]